MSAEPRPSERLCFPAHELAAMARTGLEFVADPYDRDRFERVGAIAHETLAVRLGDPDDPPEALSALRRAMLRDAARGGEGAVFQ
ncbi:MAG: NUDIX hydrolase N-terminal domain-containing protein [Candidatus Limnocylindria bacterium]